VWTAEAVILAQELGRILHQETHRVGHHDAQAMPELLLGRHSETLGQTLR
jgi:hypothetical protein